MFGRWNKIGTGSRKTAFLSWFSIGKKICHFTYIERLFGVEIVINTFSFIEALAPFKALSPVREGVMVTESDISFFTCQMLTAKPRPLL